jgi:hypothetical protein
MNHLDMPSISTGTESSPTIVLTHCRYSSCDGLKSTPAPGLGKSMNIHLFQLVIRYPREEAALLIPGLDHSNNTRPPKIGLLFIGSHDPVQIPHSIINYMPKIYLCYHVDSKTLTRLLYQRDSQLSQNLTPRPVATK